MDNELIKTAYAELEKLKKERPSWEVYTRINALRGSILYLQEYIGANKEISVIDEAIDEMVMTIGETATIEFFKRMLKDLKKDMDCVSPHLSNCIINKLKERYEKNV